jgi:hypothetical protein
MTSLGEDTGSARPREFRHFSGGARLARIVVLGFSSVLVACEGEGAIPSYEYIPTGTTKFCPGAYTPRSEICWDSNDGGDEGPIMANSAAAQENGARLGGNRCAEGIVGAPGVEGTLTVSFRTEKLGGMYTPANCGAVWIEDADGLYVRTLELWAGERANSIAAWRQSRCDKDPKIADVITSATLEEGPAAHTSKWDTRDFRGRVVSDGVYSLWMQVTENELVPEGPFIKIDFAKGAAPVTVTPPPEEGFKDITLVYAPNSAAAPPATAP